MSVTPLSRRWTARSTDSTTRQQLWWPFSARTFPKRYRRGGLLRSSSNASTKKNQQLPSSSTCSLPAAAAAAPASASWNQLCSLSPPDAAAAGLSSGSCFIATAPPSCFIGVEAAGRPPFRSITAEAVSSCGSLFTFTASAAAGGSDSTAAGSDGATPPPSTTIGSGSAAPLAFRTDGFLLFCSPAPSPSASPLRFPLRPAAAAAGAGPSSMSMHIWLIMSSSSFDRCPLMAGALGASAEPAEPPAPLVAPAWNMWIRVSFGFSDGGLSFAAFLAPARGLGARSFTSLSASPSSQISLPASW
mmetsp:Transcript_45574/g.120426  ORF Transcript_45574/g.120426 Transcript_45574/m.120426 type:complete len:302 (+) Transcript_45574:2897-3802(+)